MKKLLWGLLLVCYSSLSHADYRAITSAFALTAQTGAILAMNEVMYQNWLNSELEDWKDQLTETTARLYSQCNVSYEVRILGNNRINVAYITMSNNSAQSITVKPSRIYLNFDSGKRRLPYYPIEVSDQEVKAGWKVSLLIPFPKKTDFKDEDGLTIEVPLFDESGAEKECKLLGKLERDTTKEQPVRSYTRASTFDFVIGAGVSLFPTGDNKNYFNDKSSSFVMDLHLFPWVSHGFHAGFMRNDMKAANNQLIASNIPGRNEVEMSEFMFAFGYTYRHFFSERLSMNYMLSITANSIEDLKKNNPSEQELESEVGFMHKFNLDYYWYTSDYMPIQGDFGSGIYVMHRYLPKGNVGGVNYGGFVFGVGVNILRMAF